MFCIFSQFENNNIDKKALSLYRVLRLIFQPIVQVYDSILKTNNNHNKLIIGNNTNKKQFTLHKVSFGILDIVQVCP